MKTAVIGFGNAGSKIADELLSFEAETDRGLIRSLLAVNSARVDLARLENVPEDRRVLIGQTDERSKGHGVGGDPDLGAEITRQDRNELDRALDDVPVYEVDAFLIVAGLAGGTGSGGAPELAAHINESYEEPVYGLGVLPSEDEGGRAALNAARSVQSFANATSNLLLFDNEIWRGNEDSVEAGYQRTNREIAKRIVTLLGTGEIDDYVSENAMDSSDIRRTLSTGGVSTIAYAEAELSPNERGGGGLLDRFRTDDTSPEDEADPATKINGLIRQAVRSRLTCPAAVDSAERSLIVVSGPPDQLSRKGVESGRRWLERTTDSVEILAGDDPRPESDRLSVVVLLSNVAEVPRIDSLQEKAVEARQRIEERRTRRDREIEELLTDEYGELDPV